MTVEGLGSKKDTSGYVVYTMKLNTYISKHNTECKKRDIRAYDYVVPAGTIVGVMCGEDNKIVLIEANGKGSFQQHSFPTGMSFSCVHRLKQKTSFMQKLLKVFKK